MIRIKGGKILQTPPSKKPTYALPPEKHFRGRANHFSKMGLLRHMDDGLAAADGKRLLDSPLGGIVKLSTHVTFSTTLIHYFLEHQLKTRKKCETWYEIQGRLLRFSMREFALVTGMNPPTSCSTGLRVNTSVDERVVTMLQQILDRLSGLEKAVGEIRTQISHLHKAGQENEDERVRALKRRAPKFPRRQLGRLRFIEQRAEGATEFADLDDKFIAAYRYMLAAHIFSRCTPSAPAPPTPTATRPCLLV